MYIVKAYVRPLEVKDCPISVLPEISRRPDRPGGVLKVTFKQCLYQACCRMNNNSNSKQ